MQISYLLVLELETDDPMPSIVAHQRRLESVLEHSTAVEAIEDAMQANAKLRIATAEDFER